MNRIFKKIIGKPLLDNWETGVQLENVKNLYNAGKYYEAEDAVEKIQSAYNWPIIDVWKYKVLNVCDHQEEGYEFLSKAGIKLELNEKKAAALKLCIEENGLSVDDNSLRQSTSGILINFKDVVSRLVRAFLLTMSIVFFGKLIGDIFIGTVILVCAGLPDFAGFSMLSLAIFVGELIKAIIAVMALVVVLIDSLKSKYKKSILDSIYSDYQHEASVLKKKLNYWSLCKGILVLALLVGVVFTFLLPLEQRSPQPYEVLKTYFATFFLMVIPTLVIRDAFFLSIFIGLRDWLGGTNGSHKQKILVIVSNLLCILLIASPPNIRTSSLCVYAFCYFYWKKNRSVSLILIFSTIFYFLCLTKLFY